MSPARSRGSGAPRSHAPAPNAITQRSPERAALELEVVGELEAWRVSAVPDASAPLGAEDVARLVRECFAALGIDPDVGADVSVNTVHYYRRKDIIDAPVGRTSSARYGLRHVWQAAGARLAGYLGLVTLAEARGVMRDADESSLIAFVAARVADARARQAVRRAAERTSEIATLAPDDDDQPIAPPEPVAPPLRARPLPGATHVPVSLQMRSAAGFGLDVRASLSSTPSASATPHVPPPRIAAGFSRVMSPATPSAHAEPLQAVPAIVVALPGNALCVIPRDHPAHESRDAAIAIARALAAALGVSIDPIEPPKDER